VVAHVWRRTKAAGSSAAASAAAAVATLTRGGASRASRAAWIPDECVRFAAPHKVRDCPMRGDSDDKRGI